MAAGRDQLIAFMEVRDARNSERVRLRRQPRSCSARCLLPFCLEARSDSALEKKREELIPRGVQETEVVVSRIAAEFNLDTVRIFEVDRLRPLA